MLLRSTDTLSRLTYLCPRHLGHGHSRAHPGHVSSMQLIFYFYFCPIHERDTPETCGWTRCIGEAFANFFGECFLWFGMQIKQEEEEEDEEEKEEEEMKSHIKEASVSGHC